ncbi:MAG: GNAT family N-acetyltransferase [Nitriliruptor sp.]|nr:MAG: GNAT family N-acetyltransferase [Nitriliruptor sp.]
MGREAASRPIVLGANVNDVATAEGQALASSPVDDVVIADFDRDGDVAGCVAVYVDAFATPPWNEQWPEATARDRLLEIADTPGSVLLVARNHDRVLGLLAGYVETFHPADRFQLAELAVDPDHRRRGIAGGLVAELVDRLTGGGIAEIFLITGTAEPARQFWQTQSFVESQGRTVMVRRSA